MLNNIFFPKFLKKILLPVNVFGSKQIIISKSTPGIRLLDIGKKRPKKCFSLFQHNQHFKLITIIYKRAFNTPMMI